MINIGFTGSRAQYWSDLNKVDDLIAKILLVNLGKHQDGIHLHIGDANGVDEIVLNWSNPTHLDIPITVYGLNENFRNTHGMLAHNVTLVNTEHPNWKQGYAIRDKKMVDNVDKLYAIWDGTSKGTKLTFEYAIKQGKQVHIAQLVNDKWVWTNHNIQVV